MFLSIYIQVILISLHNYYFCEREIASVIAASDIPIKSTNCIGVQGYIKLRSGNEDAV